MRIRMPKWRDVSLPAGAVPANWPILVGIGISVVLLVGLLMTGEEPIIQPDPLDVAPEPIEPGDVEVRDPRRVEQMTGDVEQLVRDLRNRQDRAADQQAAQLDAEERAAAVEQRARAARLAQAREYVAQLRAQRAQPELPSSTVDSIDRVARTSGEADLLETLRLEDINRQVAAFRAPFVVSSARGIGERQHDLAAGAVPPPPRPAPVPAFPGGVVGDLPAAGVPGSAAAGVPAPAGVGLPVDTTVVAPAGLGDPQAQFPGAPGPGQSVFDDPVPPAPSGAFAPRAPPAAVPSGYELGPSAGDPAAFPSGVVVTPIDAGGDRVFEGTMIPAVLQTQLDGEFSGPLSAQVTRHLYSPDRQRVLIPRGTIALGTSSGVQDLWQGRLAIGFHRLIFPDGRWVSMEFAGMSGLGETSLHDQVNRHYIQLFGVAGGIGALAGFSQSGSQTGGFRSAASEQMASTALQIVSQFLNRMPEVTIRAGHRVNIRLMQDLVIPHHPRMPVEP